MKTNTEKNMPIDQFEILRELGRGGTSIVYLVKSKQSGRQYAMKVLKPELADVRGEVDSSERDKEAESSEGLRINAGYQEEFGVIAKELLRAESQTLAELNSRQSNTQGSTLGITSGSHPYNKPDSKLRNMQTGIPSYYGEVYRDGDFAGFLMEYVEGESLQKLLDEGRAFTVREAAEMGAGLCRVLAKMHEMQPPRIYRDLKPGNVLVREDGSCVLVDYGAVRAFRRGAAGDTHPLGTEGYAAPEQYGGWEQSDPRTDVYGAGAVLHHMLTGRTPLETGLRPLAEVMETAGDSAQEAQQLAEMDKILTRCCSIAPSMRFSSCRELENALGRLCGEEAKMPLGLGKALDTVRSLLLGKQQFPKT